VDNFLSISPTRLSGNSVATIARPRLSALTVNLVQPLLRGAFREVRLEGLTQAERNVCMRFATTPAFASNSTSTWCRATAAISRCCCGCQGNSALGGEPGQSQAEPECHRALADAGIVETIQVDQVFQGYQTGQLQLIRAQNGLQTPSTRTRSASGCHPRLKRRLNDDLLKPFETQLAGARTAARPGGGAVGHVPRDGQGATSRAIGGRIQELEIGCTKNGRAS